VAEGAERLLPGLEDVVAQIQSMQRSLDGLMRQVLEMARTGALPGQRGRRDDAGGGGPPAAPSAESSRPSSPPAGWAPPPASFASNLAAPLTPPAAPAHPPPPAGEPDAHPPREAQWAERVDRGAAREGVRDEVPAARLVRHSERGAAELSRMRSLPTRPPHSEREPPGGRAPAHSEKEQQ